jgi:uncharacterized membrane protein (TIGR02234 family)
MPDVSSSAAPPRPAPRRARLVSVLAILVCGGIGVISSTQTWLTVALTGSAAHELTVAGSVAIPVLTPLSLAVLALGAALSIVGTVLRYVFGVLTVVVALALGFLSAQIAFTHPVSAVARTVTDATGITGDAVAGLIASITASAWPVVTLVASAVLLLAGVFVLVTARTWRSTGRRYRTAPASSAASTGPLDAVDSWDDLSRGQDPTR